MLDTAPWRLRLALSLLPAVACQDPTISVPDIWYANPDLGPDGGGQAPWRGVVDAVVLESEVKLSPADRWREWKRDPDLVFHGGQKHLFFAGSPSPPNAQEQWSIGRISAAPDASFQAAPQRFERILAPVAGPTWDSLDLTGPSVLPPSDGKEWRLWYAATGDPQRPDYVSQIGLATSLDGTFFQRRATPVLAAPPFTAGGAEGRPLRSGPDSHGLWDPFVIRAGNNLLWMYYAGLSCDESRCRFQILRATSQDGVSFDEGKVVLSGREGVEAEAGGVAGPSVLVVGNQIFLAYTALREIPRRSRASIRDAMLTGTIGLALSSDGLTFSVAHGDRPLVGKEVYYNTGGSSGPSLYLHAGEQPRLLFGGITASMSPAFLSIGAATLLR